MRIASGMSVGAALGVGLFISACSSTDPSATVEVDGQRMDGTTGFTEIHCTYDSGSIGITSGGGEQGAGLLGNLSTEGGGVSSLTLLLDGMPYTATHTGSTDVGSVAVERDGSRYTLTGTAQTNPNGPSKKFRVEVTCR